MLSAGLLPAELGTDILYKALQPSSGNSKTLACLIQVLHSSNFAIL